MTMSRILATACAAVLLPFATAAHASGPKGVNGIPPNPAAPAKSAEQARVEMAAMRADGTLQRYQSLRLPPPVGVRDAAQLRTDLQRPPQVAQDYRTIYTGG